jgi:hypothetical protein
LSRSEGAVRYTKRGFTIGDGFRRPAVKQAHEELQRELSALRSRFTDTGHRAAAAAQAMTATILPEAELIEDLAEAGRAFARLRTALLEEAAPLSPVPDATSLTSLAHLETFLRAAMEAEEQRVRQAAWEGARDMALLTLDRVERLIHREDTGFAGLVACQAKAREMHRDLTLGPPDDLATETTLIEGRVQPFAELVALVDGWDVLDDDRCAALQDAITQTFGRPLALAALRGKLGNEGEVITPPAQTVRPAAVTGDASAARPSPPPDPDAERVSFAAAAAAPASAATATAPAAPEPAVARAAPASAERVVAANPSPPGGAAFVIDRLPMPAGRSGGAPTPPVSSPALTRPAAQPVVASAPTSVAAEIRMAGDKVQVETSAEQRDREASLEAMAAQSAQWWVAARKGWNDLRAGAGSLADVTKETLKRYPYLLSVPLQQSADQEDGRLAEGYALLLEHVEKQEEGFVNEALTRLNPQFTAGKDEYQLGQELYLYVVAEGRLYKTYPDFIKDVMTRAIPEPGFWVQGGLTEHTDETATFRRADPAGTQALKLASISDDKERAAPHVFGMKLGALTTRFFKVEAGDLPDPPDVEIKLKENDSASDRAWIVSLPAEGKPEAPKKHKASGTVIPALGKQHRLVWIGVFNADPNNEKTYELAITLKRKARAATPATAAASPAKPSPFAPRNK